MIEACHTFPGAGTPTRYLELHTMFSPWVCNEIDKGLAQFRLWYTSRMEAQRKVGKHKWEPKFKTLSDVLGVTEAIRRGGFSSGKELTDVSKSYLMAVTAAKSAGKPVPDVTAWMAAQQDPDGPDEDEDDD